MAIEQKRKCGFRKVGGLYLVDDGSGLPCDRLPFELTVCPTCSCGIKQSRGWTWIDVPTLVGGEHNDSTEPEKTYGVGCNCTYGCPLCHNPAQIGKAGLLWIGAEFYPTVDDFLAEARTMGISRRIKAVPRNFKLGETWVLLAHPKTIARVNTVDTSVATVEWLPAIFRVFKPARIEKIVSESQAKDFEFMEDLAKKGLTPVVVPDSDGDHQGSIWDKKVVEV